MTKQARGILAISLGLFLYLIGGSALCAIFGIGLTDETKMYGWEGFGVAMAFFLSCLIIAGVIIWIIFKVVYWVMDGK